MTPEEAEERQRTDDLLTLVHLELESFYIFAKILLDRIADTVGYFYSIPLNKKGSSYSQLTIRFQNICSQREFLIEPPDLPTLMQELKTQITDFRTETIEHFSNPRVMLATITSKNQKAQIVQNVIYQEIPSEHLSAKKTRDPDKLLAEIDKFIVAITQFFEINLKKSILPNHTYT